MKRQDILSPNTPRQGGPIGRAVGRVLGGAVLRLLGWTLRGQLPDEQKLLIIVAPHTSNWDYIIAMAAKFYLGLQVRYLMKSEINIWPFRNILKWSGGVPVYRFEKTDILAQTIDWLNGEENVWLGMSPEGTRSKIEKWKTGFLRIAHGAKIPIFIAAIDGKNKSIVFDKLVQLSDLKGDLDAQAKSLQDYYGDRFIGIKPENQ